MSIGAAVLGSYCEEFSDAAVEKNSIVDVEDFEDGVECASRCKSFTTFVSRDESDWDWGLVHCWFAPLL